MFKLLANLLKRPATHPYVAELAADLEAHGAHQPADDLRNLPPAFLDLVQWSHISVFPWGDTRLPMKVRAALEARRDQRSIAQGIHISSCVLDWTDSDTDETRVIMVINPTCRDDFGHEMLHVADFLADPALSRKTFQDISLEGAALMQDIIKAKDTEPGTSFSFDLSILHAMKAFAQGEHVQERQSELIELLMRFHAMPVRPATLSLPSAKTFPSPMALRSALFAFALTSAKIQDKPCVSAHVRSEIIARRYEHDLRGAAHLARSALAVAQDGCRLQAEGIPAFRASGSEWDDMVEEHGLDGAEYIYDRTVRNYRFAAKVLEPHIEPTEDQAPTPKPPGSDPKPEMVDDVPQFIEVYSGPLKRKAPPTRTAYRPGM